MHLHANAALSLKARQRMVVAVVEQGRNGWLATAPRAQLGCGIVPAPPGACITAPIPSSSPCCARCVGCGSPDQATNAPKRLTDGSGNTTITDHTQPSAENHPSPA
jgi:hypothetical protein